MYKFNLFFLSLAVCLTFSFTPISFAQSVVQEEVTVTARKREESSQDVPIMLSAVTGEFLADNAMQDFTQIEATSPSLFVRRDGRNSSAAMVSIRGIGSSRYSINIENAVGIYLDGAYVHRNTGLLSDLFDVRQVEILRGAQGTLFGKNSTGGALQVFYNKPSLEGFDGKVSITLGSREKEGRKLMLNLPLTESTAARFVAVKNDQDGFVRNIDTGNNYGNEDTATYRASIYTEIDDKTDLTITSHNYQDHSRGYLADCNDFSYDTQNRAPVASIPWVNSIAGIADDQFNTCNTSSPFASYADESRGVNKVDADRMIIELNSDTDYGLATLIYADSTEHVLQSTWNMGIHRASTAEYANVGPLISDTESNSLELRLTGSIDKFTYTLGYFESEETGYSQTDVQLYPEIDVSTLYSSAASTAGGILAGSSGALLANAGAALNGTTAAITAPSIAVSGTGATSGTIALATQLGNEGGSGATTTAYTNFLLAAAAQAPFGASFVGSRYDEYDVVNESQALFAEVVYKYNDKMNITFGMRSSDDDKTFNIRSWANSNKVASTAGRGLATKCSAGTYANGECKVYQSFSNTSGRFITDYTFDNGNMIFASYSEAYTSGNVNNSPPITVTKPQDIKSYEIGHKGDYLDGLLRVNASIFTSTYNNRQDNSCQVDATGAIVCTQTNIGEIDIEGIELDATAFINDTLSLRVFGSVIEGRYPVPRTRYDFLNGNAAYKIDEVELPGTPEQFGAVLTYSPNEMISSSIIWKYYGADITEDNITTPTSIPLFTASRNLVTPSYSLVDINAKWSFNESSSASFYIKNATDEVYARSNNDGSAAGFIFRFYQPPREAGISFTNSF
jgi:outer membrane receptor protein involved in Fe transport